MKAILLYSSYGAEETAGISSGMLVFIAILFITFGVLQIILFFKLWAMTNNIRAIKGKYCEENTSGLIRKLLILGEKEKVKEILIDDFFKSISSGDYYMSFDNEKKLLEDSFRRIREEVPQYIKDLTEESYIKLFL